MSLKSGTIPKSATCTNPRLVLAFTIQALQKCTRVVGPPKSNVREQNPPTRKTRYLKYLERGDIPIKTKADGTDTVFEVPVSKLDYEFYLPLFLSGLLETTYPTDKFAEDGLHELIDNGKEKVTNLLPLVIIPIRTILLTKVPSLILKGLNALQHMLRSCSGFGRALLPYYRQLLPVFNLLMEFSPNPRGRLIESADPSQDLYQMLSETLELMEFHGGHQAYVNIKYLIPTYESLHHC